MPNTYEGQLNADGLRFAIVAARFNRFVTDKLLEGAIDGVRRHGGQEDNIDVFWVPGAFEIPLVARRLAQSGKYQAIICLGCIIRGATPHFEYVSAQCTAGIAGVSAETGVPAILGVLTTETVEQAIERAGGKAGNKGFDAAVAAIEMASFLRDL